MRYTAYLKRNVLKTDGGAEVKTNPLSKCPRRCFPAKVAYLVQKLTPDRSAVSI